VLKWNTVLVQNWQSVEDRLWNVGVEIQDHDTIEGDGTVHSECWELVTQGWSVVSQQTWVLSCTATTTARFHTAKCCELMIVSGGGGLALISIFKQKLVHVLPPAALRYAKDKTFRRQYNKS
jgi:hypothetical protein